MLPQLKKSGLILETIYVVNKEILQKNPRFIIKSGNGVLVNFIIQELKFCKIAQLFFVSVSLVRGKFEGTREFLFQKIRT